MARYMRAPAPVKSSSQAGLAGSHSNHSSPDSVLSLFSNSPPRRSQAQGVPVPAATGHDEEILDLWDNIWFGVSDSPPQLRLISSRQAKATADPLDSVPLLNGLPTGLQTASALGSYQRHAVAAAMVQQQQQLLLIRSQQQAAGQQQRHLLPTVDDGSILVVPQQNGNTLAKSRNTGSKAVPMPQEDQQTPFAEQLDSSMQQQQQGPAPYVLGTWAQRQFIMPLNTALQKADDAAAAAQQAAAMPGTSVAQPIPANGRWPSNGSSGHSSRGSNGSKASQGSGGAAAAAAAANGDADGVDAAATAAPAAEVGQLAQVHGGNAAALAAAAAAAAAAVEDAVVAQRGSRCSFGTDDEEEAVQQAAWRWRFAKRWQAEQTRPPAEHAEHASVGDGGMEEALQYLAACGENWHLARAASIDPASDSRLLGTLGTPSLLSAELLVDESFSAHGSRGGLLQSTGSDMLGSGCLSREASSAGVGGQHLAGHAGGQHHQGRHGAGRGGGEATQQVTGITKRAAQLLAAQSDINKAVTQRWREVQSVQAGELWVGALLESAEVDDWGSYKFLLLRLRDRAGRQKLLVRGANYASDAKIVEGLHRQMMAACAAHDVCAEAIEVVGGGIMEWRRHRDRHLHISGGYVGPASGPGGPSTGSEVMNLAAVLTKQHLPMHYKVTSEGGKVL